MLLFVFLVISFYIIQIPLVLTLNVVKCFLQFIYIYCLLLISLWMALNSLLCADVPLTLLARSLMLRWRLCALCCLSVIVSHSVIWGEGNLHPRRPPREYLGEYTSRGKPQIPPAYEKKILSFCAQGNSHLCMSTKCGRHGQGLNL